MMVWTRARFLVPGDMTVGTRNAVVGLIGLICILLTGILVASMFAGEMSERTVSLIQNVLGTFATVLAGLLLFLRLESVNTKTDNIEQKVDEAAGAAVTAAHKASVVERKIDRVHDDFLNGPMRSNIKKAIQEDRHDKAKRETVDTLARSITAQQSNPDAVAKLRKILEELDKPS